MVNSKLTQSVRPLRIGVFNVKYSPNLGDGLLAKCLELELLNVQPEMEVSTFDLAGRQNYVSGNPMRRQALAALGMCPLSLRQSFAQAVLGRKLNNKLIPMWRSSLTKIDAAIIGGGNLFADADLNFPLKIHSAANVVRGANIPSAIFAVGVSDNWSTAGEQLFQDAVSALKPVHVTVRDQLSAKVWEHRVSYSAGSPPEIVQDPGILVFHHVPRIKEERQNGKLIGIGLTHPTAVSYHADEPSAQESISTKWFLDVIQCCVNRGWKVAIFNNGSPEDHAYQRKIQSICNYNFKNKDILFQPRFRHPDDLASFISSLDLMMAHRLHASIAAYSYRVPHIGFSWDAKLKSFFSKVDRGSFLCTVGVDSPEDVVSLGQLAMNDGIDQHRHHRIVTQARLDILNLFRRLTEALPARVGLTNSESDTRPTS